jgi:hypothetical protein
MAVKPNVKVGRRFIKRLTQLVQQHRELLLAIHNKRNEASLETILSEQFLMAVAVLWEAFVNDLFIAYVTMKPETFLNSLEERINASVSEKFGSEAAKSIKLKLPESITRNKALALVDPKGWNIAFVSFEAMANRANQILAAAHAQKFALAAEDVQLLNLLVALRNYIGHRSLASRQSLKQALLAATDPANLPFTAQLRDIGSYLKFKNANGESRAILLARRLETIAGRISN